MARKIFSGILISLSVLLLVLSLIAIGAAWVYNEPLTREALSRLEEIDAEIIQAQAALQSSAQELERALRIVDATETALQKLAQQSNSAENMLGNIQNTLDEKVLPELKETRGRIGTARSALQSLESLLSGVSSFAPNVDLSIPDNILKDLIASTNSLDEEIASMEILVQQASTFVSDTSYLLGGDMNETRESLQNLLASVKTYEKKVTAAHEQLVDVVQQTPTWIDRASIGLTIFLLWFALSQFGLFLHGLNLRAGGDPLMVLRRRREIEAARLENEAVSKPAD